MSIAQPPSPATGTPYGTLPSASPLPQRVFRAGDPTSQFASQMDAFSRAARAGVPHLTPGEMGLRDMRLIEAIYRSADAEGDRVRVGIAV